MIDRGTTERSVATATSATEMDEVLDAMRFPQVPRKVADVGIGEQVLEGLMIKLAASAPTFTTSWAVNKLKLSVQVVESLCWKLASDRLLDIVETQGHYSHVYAATQRCRDSARTLLDLSGYIGPAPVSLEDYVSSLEQQYREFPRASFDEIQAALAKIVLSPAAVETASLAAASNRSLFAFGPAGNGKTTLGRCLQNALLGELWIPYCIAIEHQVIRMFDDHVHQVIDPKDQAHPEIDQRWVRIRRPFVVAGGEMTLQEMDLVWSPSYRYYQAPPHLKANGGIFMIDDFGRQRIAPHELLNRWIVPMEDHVDHLTLVNGQKIQVPFETMLIIATNLTVSQVADPAFLRRMGYRLLVEPPSPDAYRRIFQRYADQHGMQLEPGVIENVLGRYVREQRDLRGSEPRDLLERARDVCQLHGRPLVINVETIEVAWRGYFGGVAN